MFLAKTESYIDEFENCYNFKLELYKILDPIYKSKIK